MKFLRLEKYNNGQIEKVFVNIEHISSIEPGYLDKTSNIYLFNRTKYLDVIGDAEELINTVESYFEEMERKLRCQRQEQENK